MPAGRPLKFKSAEVLEKTIQAYFDYCDNHTKEVQLKNKVKIEPDPLPYTVTGLAAYLGCDRDTLLNYQDKEEFFGTIKSAKTKIEANLEERALMNRCNAVVAIFSLKNNFNWKDKTEVEHTGEQLIKIEPPKF